MAKIFPAVGEGMKHGSCLLVIGIAQADALLSLSCTKQNTLPCFSLAL
jgi:hypothetical protein